MKAIMVTVFDRERIDQLLARGRPADALAVVARTLPKRYVVAWACECFKSLLATKPETSDVDRAGLALAQQWLADPTEDNCRAAMEFAEQGQVGTPGVWIAASAAWSGASLLPRGYDPIPPPDHLPAEAAVAALRLAACQEADFAELIGAFIARALKIFGNVSASAAAGRAAGAAAGGAEGAAVGGAGGAAVGGAAGAAVGGAGTAGSRAVSS
jgi:hypothetical protein